MRIYSAEYDVPDGVFPPDRIATEIAAEERREQSFRGIMRHHHSERASDRERQRWGVPSVSEARQRDRLLGAARRGDVAAEFELWLRYRLRLIPPAA